MIEKIELSEFKIDKKLGYLYVYKPNHVLSNKSGKVYMHRYVISQNINRILLSNEHVHHIDGDKTNNDLSNLKLLSNKEHGKEHKKLPIQFCKICGKETKTKKKIYCSKQCANIGKRKVLNRPSKYIIIKELSASNFTQVALKYGVSDNTIRKWIK